MRWLAHPDGGSLVAAFAPVADWTEAHPPGVPAGVQLVHVGPDGAPRTDRGGLSKRSHGTMSAAVAVIGAPLWRAVQVHVCEGLADALAVPVLVWPDDNPPGRNAAGQLVTDLRRLGAVAALAAVPDGNDPAGMAGPFCRKAPR